MGIKPETRLPGFVQGQFLRRNERREVVIYLRNDALWIADFIDGHGELIDPVNWFRFNCGGPTTWPAKRRMLLESAVPLSAEIVARIECLHRLANVRNGKEDELCTPNRLFL